MILDLQSKITGLGLHKNQQGFETKSIHIDERTVAMTQIYTDIDIKTAMSERCRYIYICIAITLL